MNAKRWLGLRMQACFSSPCPHGTDYNLQGVRAAGYSRIEMYACSAGQLPNGASSWSLARVADRPPSVSKDCTKWRLHCAPSPCRRTKRPVLLLVGCLY